MTQAQQTGSLPNVTDRIPVGDPIYNKIVEHLYDEAALLDSLNLREWQKSFTSDIVYQAPVQITERRSEKSPKVRQMMHLFENANSMDMRIHKVCDTNVGWAEEPRSRTRRLITNILVNKTEQENEFSVVSCFLLSRNRFEAYDLQQITGERHDRLRLIDGKFKLARREIIIDMSVLSMPNLAIFL
ncbi:MAG: aromatic-ring-hydroxylating dioxygenase subunit beta [Spongiibacteraceae bacterium]|jgi:3-phenylpropionate/cinnamic acid dioxygenase small subunit